MRELGTTSEATISNRQFIVHQMFQPRDTRSIDDRCILVIEFAASIRKLSLSEFKDLGSVLMSAAVPIDDDNEADVAKSVHGCLARVSGLVDALRIGVGEEIACLLGGVAAAHAHGLKNDPDNSKRVFETVTRRIRNAGRLLCASKAGKPSWMVLTDPHADLDNRLGVRPESRTGERLKVVVAIALGEMVPILPDNCPTRVLQTRHCAHVRFKRSIELLTNSSGSWSLADALIPCNAMPIRTEHYVTYVTAVSVYVNKLVDALTREEGDDSVNTRELRCAWALVALSNPYLQSNIAFSEFVCAWCKVRAHQPPEHGASSWMTARAVLGQSDLDVNGLSGAVETIVSSKAYSPDQEGDVFGRIASLCIATRTLTGIALLHTNARVLRGVMHCATHSENETLTACPPAINCLSRSPSGTLEFGFYESGWSEWDRKDDAVSANVAVSVQHQIVHTLNGSEKETSKWTHTEAALRLSMLPDNLLTRPWKFAIESLQPAVERSLVQITGSGFGALSDMREDAIRAVVFRRRCLRALADASIYPLQRGVDGRRNAALVTWIANDQGACVCFARKFVSDVCVDAQTVVIDYERILRTQYTIHKRKNIDECTSTTIPKNTRITRLGFSKMLFVDEASRQSVTGPGTMSIEFCSPNAVLSASSCAVSVVHWPVV
jgi:hypothetical protein